MASEALCKAVTPRTGADVRWAYTGTDRLVYAPYRLPGEEIRIGVTQNAL